MEGLQIKTKEPSISASRKRLIIIVVVAVIFVIALSIGLAVGLSKEKKYSVIVNATANATAKAYTCRSFSRQAVILVSLDGFRSDYFYRDFSPNIRKLAENGVRAKYMISQYPTKTFPNHYTIVTGLYPEYHGIVSNSFKDENRTDYFAIGRKSTYKSKWWKGEPIWNTVRKQGLKSASYFWVGSEMKINGLQPNYWLRYNGKVPFTERVDQVLKWLEMEPSARPDFITLYFNEPDSAGHRYGPDSTPVNKAIKNVDDMIGRLVNGIKQRKLSSCVNVIVVADHGMAKIDCPRTMYLDQIIPLTNISVVGQGASSLLYLDNPNDATKVVKKLRCVNKNLRAFRRGDLDTPRRIHYSSTKRIGDVILVPDLGWSLLRRKQKCNPSYNGAHGYDNIYPEMEALFVANGPAFKSGLVAEPFANIEVYNLLAEILKVKPAPNNGTYGSLSYMLKDTSTTIKPASNSDGKDFSTDCKFICQPNAASNNCTNLACPACKAPKEAISAYMANLILNDQQRKVSMDQNLPWGAPKGGAGKGGCLLVQKNFVTAYSSSLKVPLLVGYKLEASQLKGNATDPCPRLDPRLKSNETSSCTDYSNSNYTRNQLLSRFDFLRDNMSQQDTFLISNSVPQYVAFAGKLGLWQRINDVIKIWAARYGPLQIITGSIFDSNGNGFRDEDMEINSWVGQKGNSPAIPTHFYKIVTRCNTTVKASQSVNGCRGKLESLAFVFPHTQEPACQLHKWQTTLLQYTASINDIEKLTGSNLFPNLPFPFAARFKTHLPLSLWAFT